MTTQPRHAARASERAGSSASGTLTLGDGVVEKIAVQAVRSIDEAAGGARRVLGVQLGSDDPRDARVSADVEGGIATVSVDMTVTWPTSVRAVTREVRQRIVQDVARYAGVQVQQVDIDVVGVIAPHAGEPERRVR